MTTDAADNASAISRDTQPTNVRYQILGLLCGLSMITYLDRVCFASAAPAMADDLGLASKEQLKWAHTAFAIAYGAFEIPAGWLGDRWGPRSTLIRIVLGWSLFTAVTGLIGLKFGTLTLGGLSTLIAVRFLFGAGEAGAYPNIARAIHNWFPLPRWEMAQGYIWMSGRIVGGLTPLIWAILVSGTNFTPPLLHWRGVFVLFGALGLLWCVVFSIWFRDQPARHPGVNTAERVLIGSTWQPDSHTGIPVAAMLSNRSLWALCIMYSLINYGWYFNISYMPGYLDTRFHLPPGDTLGAIYKGAPLWVGAFGCLLGGVIVNFLTRLLGDRRQARQVLGCGAMLLCAAAWWGVYHAQTVTVFCALVSLAGFGVDLTLGAAWATCQDLGRKHAAVTAACMNTVGTAGSALAGWLIGTIVEMFIEIRTAAISERLLTTAERNSASLEGYQVVFLTFAIVYVVAAVCWCFINASQPLEAADDADRR